MKKLLMFFASLLLICSCSSDEDILTGSIQGIVTEMIDGESRPLSDVLVSIDGGASVATDNNGHYTFMDIDARPYKLRFNKYGYLSTTRDLNVIAGKSVICDVFLESEKKDLIVIEPSSLSFGTTQNELSVTITNKGSRELKWNLDLGQNSSWLSASPSAGQLGVDKKQTVVFSVDRSNLTESKSVVVNLTAGGSSFPLTVDCGIDDGKGQLAVQPTEIDFGRESSEEDITIKNLGVATLTWSVKNLMSDCISLSSPDGSIAPGGNKVVKLVLDRTKMKENLSTSFVISDGTKDIPVNVRADYVDISADMAVVPSKLDFGTDGWELPFTITNNGKSSLNWKVKSLTKEYLSLSEESGAVAPGKSREIKVLLKRKNMKHDLSTNFIVTGGGKDVEVEVHAKYVPMEADIFVSPGHLDFGKELSYLPLTIRNITEGTIEWSIKGLEEGCVSLSDMNGTLSAEGSAVVKVLLNREKMSKDINTSFVINDGSHDVKVNVTAQYYVKRGKLSLEPSSLDFGKETTYLPLKIKNIGTATMDWTVNDVMSPCISFSESSGTVAVDGSKIINVYLDRDKMDSDISTWFTISDGINEETVSVFAKYVRKYTELTVTPSVLDFGENSSERYITIGNKGNIPMTWKIGGSSSSLLSFSSTTGSVNPSESKSVSVRLDRKSMKEDLSANFIVSDGLSEKTIQINAKYVNGHGTIGNHEYVDLGLPSGLKWATCNVGASSPEDYGDYFAWGETKPKSSYDEENSNTYGKYVSDFSGDSQYDAARYNWGGTWRMPTGTEVKELLGWCSEKRTSHNGVKGILVTGPNGNSIFLPAAGNRFSASLKYVGENGYFWSSTPSDTSDVHAFGLYFRDDGAYGYSWFGRPSGQSVRPVSY